MTTCVHKTGVIIRAKTKILGRNKLNINILYAAESKQESKTNELM